MERDITATSTRLRPGMRVEVSTRYQGDWANGFEVVSVEIGGCRVRRISDGSLLPVEFAYPRVRPVVY
jgi:hypothetical protein